MVVDLVEATNHPASKPAMRLPEYIRVRYFNGRVSADSSRVTRPAKRTDPIEIANAVLFLASDEAAFTVGSELLIDGGMSGI